MRQGEQTKGKIIQSAIELFVRKGYHATSINDIMRKVEITKAGFYSHFESKSRLLLRIIDEYEHRYIDRLIQYVSEQPADALGKLNRAISFSAGFAVRNLELCLFLDYLTTELNANVDFLPSLRKVHDKYRKFIRDIIADGIRQGLIDRRHDPNLAALTFIAVHHGVLHQWSLNRNELSGIEYVKNFRRILIKGLTA